MPELPEVETIRRQLAPEIEGRRVMEAWGFDDLRFADATAATGAWLGTTARRGKYLLVDLASTPGGCPDRQLVVHLGMTGNLRLDQPDDAYTRAWWLLDDGRRLVLRDQRRFGRVAVVPVGDHSALPTLDRMGPEPLSDEFTPEGLWQAMRASRARVKTQLLNQRVVAGVGNIYADEALWRARVNPAARRLTRAQAVRLHAALRDVLLESLANGGTTFRDYRTFTGALGLHQVHLACYGREGEPCLRCGTRLRRRVLDGRSSTWCPTCQR